MKPFEMCSKPALFATSFDIAAPISAALMAGDTPVSVVGIIAVKACVLYNQS